MLQTFCFREVTRTPKDILGYAVVTAQWTGDQASTNVQLPSDMFKNVKMQPMTNDKFPYGPMIDDDIRLLEKFERNQFGDPVQPSLLDISTNGSQLGVRLSASNITSSSVEGLLLKVPADRQIITTLPPIACGSRQ